MARWFEQRSGRSKNKADHQPAKIVAFELPSKGSWDGAARSIETRKSQCGKLLRLRQMRIEGNRVGSKIGYLTITLNYLRYNLRKMKSPPSAGASGQRHPPAEAAKDQSVQKRTSGK
jgi:hypothetical protein